MFGGWRSLILMGALVLVLKVSPLPVNVARGGVARQSGGDDAHNANVLIDGDSTPHTALGTCSTFSQGPGAWWQVDLLVSYTVTSVVITTSVDCCTQGLLGAQVSVGDSLLDDGNSNPRCAVISSVADATATVSCNMGGRYVNIHKPTGSDWAMCEVKVYGTFSIKAGTVRGRHGTWSSGNTSTSCVTTEPEDDPFWKLDLMKVHRIGAVYFSINGLTLPETMDGVEIRVGFSDKNSNKRCAIVEFESRIRHYRYKCANLEGRYVHVFLPGNNKSLSLCQPYISTMAVVNVALKGVSARSSTASGLTSYLNDARTNTFVHTPPLFQWMRVDLLVPHNVTSIQVLTENGCCSPVEVKVGNLLEGDGNVNPSCGWMLSSQSQTLDCGGMVGRYVDLYSPVVGMSVSEVEVYSLKEIYHKALPQRPPKMDHCHRCGRDYVVVTKELLTWSQARDYCRLHYTDLATIGSAQDLNRLQDFVEKHNHRDFWIGLHQGVPVWTWTLWDDAHYGTQTFRNWAAGEPVSGHRKDLCAAMTMTGKWKGVECHVPNFFICYDDSLQERSVLVAKAMTFQQARDYCRAHHTDLVLIRDTEDNVEVQAKVPEGALAWIGLYAEPWAWVDGSGSSFRYWAETPSYWDLEATGQQHCAFTLDAMWRWGTCEYQRAFACYSFKKKGMLRMQLKSDLDLTDPIIQQLVLEKMNAMMKLKHMTDFRIRWRRITK